MTNLENVHVHTCKHLPCKCTVLQGAEEFCSEACPNMPSTGDSLRCGCGHVECDTFVELGNPAFGETLGPDDIPD